MKTMPISSVRGRIREYIERHAAKLGPDVVEIGSRLTNGEAWWMDNRYLNTGNWTGIDLQPGHGVDVVADIHVPLPAFHDHFTGLLCSEVLEHLQRPWIALPNVRKLLKPGAYAIFTTLFAFPEHGFPDDYYRYSRSGLATLLRDAMFVVEEMEYGGGVDVMLDDHGEGAINARNIPMHIFALARAV